VEHRLRSRILVTTFEYAADDPRRAQDALLAAVEVFARDRFVPLGVSFEITCLDPDLPFVESGLAPRPYWFIRGPGFFDRRISDDDVVSVIEDLVPTHDIVTAIIDEALAQPTAYGTTSLTELRWEGLALDGIERGITLRGTNRFHTATLELATEQTLRRSHPELFELFAAGVAAVEAIPGWQRGY